MEAAENKKLNEATKGQAAGKTGEKVIVDVAGQAEPVGRKKVSIPSAERQGKLLFQQLDGYIHRHDGFYLRDETGQLHVVVNDRRICLSQNDSDELASLTLQVCSMGTLTPGMRAAIQRLRVNALAKSGLISYRHFSAMSPDGARLYIPLEGSQLLCVSADEITRVPNGRNADSFWVEHPRNAPLCYRETDVREGLKLFEQFLVETASVSAPDFRWLIAMNCALFPFMRDLVNNRLIFVFLGARQSGKTTCAQRFSLLHALGTVTGDFSLAALANSGDTGLLCLDNKEQANLSPGLIDFCLAIATNSERGRSTQDGHLRLYARRPVCLITSIEGVVREELQIRCLNIEFEAKAIKLWRSQIESAIEKNRHHITLALMPVVQRYLQIKDGDWKSPDLGHAEFGEHVHTLCTLLHAYGDVAEKPASWSSRIIEGWSKHSNGQEVEECDLALPILQTLKQAAQDIDCEAVQYQTITHDGHTGTLYYTTYGDLLSLLQRRTPRDWTLPLNPEGMQRRLASSTFESFALLTHKNAPEIVVLKRTKRRKPVGFFVRDDDKNGDGVTVGDGWII